MPTVTPLRTGFGFGNTDVPRDFAHPPLIEAWLGAEFDSPSDFTHSDVLEWRKRLGPEWPALWQTIGAAQRHSPGTTRIERQLRNVMGDRAIRFGAKVLRLAGSATTETCIRVTKQFVTGLWQRSTLFET